VEWRSSPLPRDWKKRRAVVLRRDPVCKLCNVAPAVEVDHARGARDHSIESLRGVCTPCHRTRTGRQGMEARRRRGWRESHPGDLEGWGGAP
jgi:hypothetical protein